MDVADDFRDTFRFYKQNRSSENLQNAVNRELQDRLKRVFYDVSRKNFSGVSCKLCSELGLKDHSSWNIFSLQERNGFFMIRNPFTVEGQQLWISSCLKKYPLKPSVSNLDAHFKNVNDIWSSQSAKDPVERSYIDKLSWVTLGYHHNWDTKVYDPSQHSEFPICLKKLSQHVASCLGYKSFNPEAAIINYYNYKSSLGIHNDHSEEDLNQPILSFSFGNTGVFLIGTEDRTEKPVAIMLESGDIIILSKDCRLSYHAVPVILPESNCVRYCSKEKDEYWDPFHKYIRTHRINISVRQVFTSIS